MSDIQFIHQFNKQVCQTSTQVVNTDTPWCDGRSDVQSIIVLVPAVLLSRVFSFQNCKNGRLKLEFLPLKEYLDVLDIRFIDAVNKTFPDDATPPHIIKNLAYVSDNLRYSVSDPLAYLPRSAIKETTYGPLLKEALFTTLSGGPIDTRVQNHDTNHYDAIKNLYQQAVSNGMITDENNELYPFTDLYTAHFNNGDSLSIRLNYTVSKTRKYMFDARFGAALTGDITIGGKPIRIDPKGYTTSAVASYTISFLASDNNSYFSYQYLFDDRILYNDAVYDVQLIQATSTILSLVGSLTSVSSPLQISEGITMITALKAAYDNAVSVLSSTLNSVDPLYYAGYTYIRYLITITRISDVTLAYNTLKDRINIDPATQTITLDFTDEYTNSGPESTVVMLDQPQFRISNNSRNVVIVFPNLPALIPTYRYADITITTSGITGGTVTSSLLDGYVTGTTSEVKITNYMRSSGFTVTLNNIVSQSAFLNVTGGLLYISPSELEQCRNIQEQKDRLLDLLHKYFKANITRTELKTALLTIKNTMREENGIVGSYVPGTTGICNDSDV